MNILVDREYSPVILCFVPGEITNPLDKILVARGGRGGDRRTKFLPKKGERRNLCLDLKIIADVGFVG